MKKSMSEILEECSNIKNRADKIKFLHQHYTIQFHQVLDGMFNKNVKFLVPDTDPPYKPSQTFEAHGMLYGRARELYLYIEGRSPYNMEDPKHRAKMEGNWITLLESVDPEDAKLLCAMVKKKSPYKGITGKLIEEAYGLLH